MQWIGAQFCVCIFVLICCLWIPQTVPDSANAVADSANFWSNFEKNSVLALSV